MQYVTFFPAVTLAAIVGGYRAGLLATIIGLALATYIFTPPYYSFSVDVVQASFWPDIVFLMGGTIVSSSIEAMHRFRQKYQQELRETQEAKAHVTALNEELKKQITERKQTEAALKRHMRDLGERIKEIECLRDVTNIFLNRETSMEQALDACVRRIPAAWLDPAHTCARIRLGDQTYESANFQEAEWKLEAPISVPHMEPGLVEVFHFDEETGNEKSPFLDEERILIQSISIQITQSLNKRQAEVALQQSQKELQEAQRIAHVGSWHLDVVTNHVVWSEELYRMFGLSPELSPPDYPEQQKLFTPESWERLNAALPSTRETGIPYELELEIVRAGMGHGWILARGEALRDASGAIVGLRGIAMNITERKQAEATLQLHRKVVETTRDGFWMCDTSGYLLEVNQAYVDTIGYTREELVGMHISQISALTDTPDMVREQVEKIVGKGLSHFETRHRRKDGHLIQFEVSSTYVAESKAICCFLRNITERKMMEESLRESENRYRALVENSPFCIHEIDMSGRLTSMNRAGLNMMGVKEESQVRGLLYLDAVCAADREHIGSLLARAYTGKISHFEFKPAGMHERIFESCFVPVMNNEGTIEKLMGITEDITERKAAEEQIRNLAFYDTLTQLPNRRLLNDRLEQIMAASKRSGRYAALMFMDLDNFKPLNDMRGHDVGDLLLVEAARRISRCVREMDTVARFGGDEFVVILSELDADIAKSTSASRDHCRKDPHYSVGTLPAENQA